MTGLSCTAIQFDDHVLDIRRHELRRGTTKVALQPKTFALLAYLSAHPSRLIGKEELLRELWPGVIVTEHSLTRCIKDLRKALGDEVERPRYIETVPRLGYRFLIEPVPVTPDLGASTERVEAEPGRESSPVAASVPTRAFILLGGLISLVAVALWLSLSPSALAPAASPVALPPVLAVLPFAIQADAVAEQSDVLGRGLAEDVLNRLRLDPALRVLARGSTFEFAGDKRSATEIGKVLAADWVLRGQMAQIGPELSVDVELHEVGGEGAQWSRRYRGDANQWLKLQAEIVADTRAQLLRLPIRTPVTVVTPASPGFDAHMAYMAGREYLERRRHRWREQSLASFERALALDANNAPALAGLATILALSARGLDDPAPVIARAEAAIARALALDPNSADAYAAQGLIALQRGRHEDAEAALGQALSLDPGLVAAYSWLSIVLTEQGRNAESLAVFDRALALDPLNPRVLENYAVQLWVRGDLDGAQRVFASMLQVPNPPPAAAIRLRSLALSRGRLIEALEQAEAVERFADPGHPGSSLIPSALIYARLGMCTQAQARLKAARAGEIEAGWRPHQELAYRALGRYDALETLVEPVVARRTDLPAVGLFLGRSAVLDGRFALGVERLQAAKVSTLTSEPSNTDAIDTTLAWIFGLGQMGRRDEARAALSGFFERRSRAAAQGLTNTPDEHYFNAMALALDHRPKAALAALDRAQAQGWNDVYSAWYDPRWRSLRAHPEFLQRMGMACTSVTAERRKLVAQRSLIVPDPTCPPPTHAPQCAAIAGARLSR